MVICKYIDCKHHTAVIVLFIKLWPPNKLPDLLVTLQTTTVFLPCSNGYKSGSFLFGEALSLIYQNKRGCRKPNRVGQIQIKKSCQN
jgi:hypothetical protein